jgi:ferritin-like metal-binding protein YciE
LKAAFTAHLAETLGHIEKVAQVFALIGEKAKRKTCEATVGLLKEGDEIAEDFADSPAINAALIAAAQKVEHYETASYGCLKEWAALLRHADAAELLGEILSEEEAANAKLTTLAQHGCNEQAVGEDGDGAAEMATAKKRSSKR